MKNLLIALSLIPALVLAETGGPVNDDATQEQAVHDQIADALAVLENARIEKAADDAVVEHIYGEGSNSSFIVRTELTATQKRFLALGRRYCQMAAFCQYLSGKVESLEAKLQAFEDERNEAKFLSVKDQLGNVADMATEISNLTARVEALENEKQAAEARREAMRQKRTRQEKASADEKVQRAIDRASGGKAGKSARKETK